MGASGPGIFEDDSAQDFVALVVMSEDCGVVEDVLSVATERAFLDAELAARALAAASVVACLADGGGEVPEGLKSWARGRGVPHQNIVRQAYRAVLRVIRDSELRDLWAERDDLDAWIDGLIRLVDRLAAFRPLELREPT